jgi:hypothetical protein
VVSPTNHRRTTDVPQTTHIEEEEEEEEEAGEKSGEEAVLKAVCPEAEKKQNPKKEKIQDVSKPFLEFQTDGKIKSWILTEAKVSEFQSAFPAIDVKSEFRKALQWVIANPERRKTARGMERFLFLWLEKSSNRGNFARNGPGSPTAFQSRFSEVESHKSLG